MLETFTKRLRYLLEQRQMSISELSRRSGFSRQIIYKWLEDDFVSKHGLTTLASTLGVTDKWLKYGEQAQTKTRLTNKKQLSPFVIVEQNNEFKQAKAHMHKLNILVGSYHFAEAKIYYFNNVEVEELVRLPNSACELKSLLPTAQMKRLQINFLRLMKSQQPRIFSFSPFDDNNVFCCTFLPILDQYTNTIGLSFSLQSMQSKEQELAQFLDKKCRSCFGTLKIPTY